MKPVADPQTHFSHYEYVCVHCTVLKYYSAITAGIIKMSSEKIYISTDRHTYVTPHKAADCICFVM